MQPDAELLRRPEGVVALGAIAVLTAHRMRVPLDTETREEIEGLDVDSLIEDHTRGEQ